MARIDKTYHTLLEKILKEGYTYEDKSRKVNCLQISSYEFRHNLRLYGFPALTTKRLYWKGVVGELIWFLNGDTNIKYLLDNNINIWNKDAYNFYKKEHSDWESKYLFDFHEFITCIKMSDDELEDYLDGSGMGYKSKKYKLGDLGRVYGAQWRQWDDSYGNDVEGNFKQYYLDQFTNLIQNLKNNPMSRRHIVTAWNPGEIDEMALPPCHWSFEIIPRPLTIEEKYNLFKVTKDKYPIYGPQYTFDLKWHQRSVDTFLG